MGLTTFFIYIWINLNVYIYNTHFTIKSFEIKEKHFGKPYITPGIIRSIKHRNKLQKLFAKWPLSYETTFKKYRNIYVNCSNSYS